MSFDKGVLPHCPLLLGEGEGVRLSRHMQAETEAVFGVLP